MKYTTIEVSRGHYDRLPEGPLKIFLYRTGRFTSYKKDFLPSISANPEERPSILILKKPCVINSRTNPEEVITEVPIECFNVTVHESNALFNGLKHF